MLQGERAAAKIEVQDPSEGARALRHIGWWRCDVAHERGNGRRVAAARLPEAPSLDLAPGLLLDVPMMRRRRGGLLAVKRVETARLGNAAVMMHDLRIIDSRGRQKMART